MFEQYIDISKDQSVWETSTTCYVHDRDGKRINPTVKGKHDASCCGATGFTQVIPHMVVVLCNTD